MLISAFAEQSTLDRHAATTIVDGIHRQLRRTGTCNVVPSAGRTPVTVYAYLAKHHRKSIDWSRVTAWQMDAYVGLPRESRLSFARFLEDHVVRPLGIGEFNRIEDGEQPIDHAIKVHEQRLRARGGIDFAIHGVGINGHLGFNEPGSPPTSLGRGVTLADETIGALHETWPAHHAHALPSQGVTLGLDIILRASASLLIATGPQKRAAVASLFSRARPTPSSPATYLKRARNVTVMVTRDCAPRGTAPRDRWQTHAHAAPI